MPQALVWVLGDREEPEGTTAPGLGQTDASRGQTPAFNARKRGARFPVLAGAGGKRRAGRGRRRAPGGALRADTSGSKKSATCHPEQRTSGAGHMVAEAAMSSVPPRGSGWSHVKQAVESEGLSAAPGEAESR